MYIVLTADSLTRIQDAPPFRRFNAIYPGESGLSTPSFTFSMYS